MNLRRTFTSISLTGLVVVAFMAVAGVSASSAVAASDPCYQVVEKGTGSFNNAACSEAGGSKEYVKVESGTGTYLGKGEWCFHVSNGEPSQYKNNVCTEKELGGGYVKVWCPRLYIKGVLHKGGGKHAVETRIKSGTKFKLEGSIGSTAVTLEGNEVESTKAFVNGTEPATDEAEAIVFKKVAVTAPSSCTGDEVSSRKEAGGAKTASGVVATKAVSTLFEPGGVSGIADTFTPVSGNFVEIELKKAGTCPISTAYYAVTGHEAGEELEPAVETEYKTLKFPVASLSSLEFDGKAATLTGEAELRLTTKEVYAVH
jgi:hypothetical protein